MSNVVELVSFKLKKGVSEEQFLSASDELTANFLALQKGYIERKLAKKKDAWTDIVLWETMDDAQNAMKTANRCTVANPFLECINIFSCKVNHVTVVKNY